MLLLFNYSSYWVKIWVEYSNSYKYMIIKHYSWKRKQFSIPRITYFFVRVYEAGARFSDLPLTSSTTIPFLNVDIKPFGTPLPIESTKELSSPKKAFIETK